MYCFIFYHVMHSLVKGDYYSHCVIALYYNSFAMYYSALLILQLPTFSYMQISWKKPNSSIIDVMYFGKLYPAKSILELFGQA